MKIVNNDEIRAVIGEKSAANGAIFSTTVFPIDTRNTFAVATNDMT